MLSVTKVARVTELYTHTYTALHRGAIHLGHTFHSHGGTGSSSQNHRHVAFAPVSAEAGGSGGSREGGGGQLASRLAAPRAGADLPRGTEAESRRGLPGGARRGGGRARLGCASRRRWRGGAGRRRGARARSSRAGCRGWMDRSALASPRQPPPWLAGRRLGRIRRPGSTSVTRRRQAGPGGGKVGQRSQLR